MASSLNGGQLAGYRNVLINGAMRIYQRGDTGSATAGYQTADRWRVNGNRATVINLGPDEYAGSIGSLTIGDTLSIRQAIELALKKDDTPSQYPFLENSVWTLSFLASDAAGTGGTVDASLGWQTGSSGSGTLAHAAASQQTLTSDWQKYTFTFTITTTSLDSTWRSLNCNLILTGTGRPRVTQVQLEPGPVATPFENRPYATELALCQRYYQTISQMDISSASNTGTAYQGQAFFPVVMRETPTAVVGASQNMASTNLVPTVQSFKVWGNPTDGAQSAGVTDVTLDAEL